MYRKIYSHANSIRVMMMMMMMIQYVFRFHTIRVTCSYVCTADRLQQ